MLLALLAGVAAMAANAQSLPFVSPIFGDNMVLQRGKPNTFWGWSKPGDVVRVTIAGHSSRAVTGADGRWQTQIEPPAPGGPYTVSIDGAQHLALHEVLVGDVWLCGGQSNMELPLSRTRDGTNAIKAADHPEVRFFKVASHPSYSPATVPQGQWKICSPQSVAENGGFSAVAYYFGLRVQQEIHVPIGLVQDCLGGTPAEAWTSQRTLHRLKDFDPQLAEIERLKANGGPQYGNYIMHWYDDYDIGLKGQTWSAADLDDSDWKAVQIPGGFKELGVADVPCVCWFRKVITLPELPDGAATIFLGVVEKMDTTWINGHFIGASAWVENPRAYKVGKEILHPGKNVVAVRVLKTKPDGGFLSKPGDLRLVLGDKTVVPLDGEWKGKLSVDARPPHPLPMGFENWPVMPSVLYQGMLEPLAPLAITGAIWYQGEANADRARQYRTLLPAMIGSWRELFGQGNFPFYIVSLPAFMHHENHPVESWWAELREAQAMSANAVANSALAVTIDTGEPDNIHPQDKEIVGQRLAFCALAQHYDEKIAYQGPTLKSFERSGGSLKLNFTHTDGGLVAKDGKLEEFSIAGKDRHWHWAKAVIEGNSIVVSSPEVLEPEAARYAWQSFPSATLYNGAGLPAVPFRTDTESTKPR
ncbi:MAG TPA: sialate O-acetylesterase [Verrucomicrobiae bacterium]|nr:sialate O-acetylesterase [Verrucomicrobiae bacterium]